MKRLLGNRWVVLLLVLLAGAGWWFLDGAMGEWAWQRYAAEARARGIKLTLSELFPKREVSAAENYAAGPFFQKGDGVSGIAKFPGISPPSDSAHGFYAPANLAAWRDEFVRKGWLASGQEQGTDLEVVQRALDRVRTQLAELRQSTGRPQTYLVLDWSKADEDARMRLTECMRAAPVLRAKAMVEWTQGRQDEALATWMDLAELVRLPEAAPYLFTHLVALMMDHHLLSTLCDGLAGGYLDEPALKTMQEKIAARSPLARYAACLQGERVFLNAVMERPAYHIESRNDTWKGGKYREWLQLQRSHVWRELQISFNRALDAELGNLDLATETWKPTGDHDTQRKEAMEAVSRGVLSMAENFDPASLSFALAMLNMQAQMRMAELACALERHRLAHGRYPETLSALVPEYIAKLPPDPCNGQPFRYQLAKPDEYLLSSVGWNEPGEKRKPNQPLDYTGEDWRWPLLRKAPPDKNPKEAAAK